MKTVFFTRYGPPESLELRQVDIPTPADGQVLVRIQAASLNISDWYTLTGGPARMFQGITKPKDPHLGADIAGIVESVGSGITRFKPGDQVFGTCRDGFAEYGLAREDRLVAKPANVSFEAAAAVPVAGITALQGLRDAGHVQPGQQVLIYGASGGVGSFAVQIAKALGAEVTAVVSPRSLATARSSGADHVIDYTQEDFTRSSQRYDLILGVNGYHFITDYRRVLTERGTYIVVGAHHSHVLSAMLQAALLGPLISRKDGQKMGTMGIAKITRADLTILKEYLEAGKIQPVIDCRYLLDQIVEAFRYLGQGHARGKVIITIGESSDKLG
jgi:NADPH:quinone reductase-like Zn-dependent oxidoreductase